MAPPSSAAPIRTSAPPTAATPPTLALPSWQTPSSANSSARLRKNYSEIKKSIEQKPAGSKIPAGFLCKMRSHGSIEPWLSFNIVGLTNWNLINRCSGLFNIKLFEHSVKIKLNIDGLIRQCQIIIIINIGHKLSVEVITVFNIVREIVRF